MLNLLHVRQMRTVHVPYICIINHFICVADVSQQFQKQQLERNINNIDILCVTILPQYAGGIMTGIDDIEIQKNKDDLN